MRRTSLALFFPMLVLAGTACTAGNNLPTLTIAADKVTQTVKPGNFVTLTVTGTSNGTPFPDGMSPTPKLSTDYGSFEKPSATNPSAADDVQFLDSSPIVGHAMTVRLYADPDPGNATVTATYADAFGNSVTATVQISFKEEIKAGVVENLNLSCLTYNIGVLATQSISVQIPCAANATDSNNQAVVGSKIEFMAEAGTMKYDNGALYYFPRAPGSLNAAPRDVSPEDLPGSAEPFRTGGDGLIHNPRDGLVTIIAYTKAEKSYVVDELAMSEPYVDANDNRQYDPGENWVDLNGSGAWDEIQDEDSSKDHAIWTKIKVLWTGSLQSSAPIATVEPPFADIGYLQAQSFTLSLLDQNYNVLASNDQANDVITWGYSPQPDISLASGQSETTKLYNPDDDRRFGMLMDQNFEFLDPTSDFNWRIGGSVGVFVQDTMQCNTPLQSESFTVTGQVNRTLYLSPMGDPQGQSNESMIPAGGSLQPPPSSNCE